MQIRAEELRVGRVYDGNSIKSGSPLENCIIYMCKSEGKDSLQQKDHRESGFVSYCHKAKPQTWPVSFLMKKELVSFFL